MTREEMEKARALPKKEEMESYAKAYASRILFPQSEEDFKAMIAEAYFAGGEYACDFYVENFDKDAFKEVEK